MNLLNLRVRSLKARMTLSTLAIFLVSMWALAYYASTTLRLDMEHMSGHQQFSTVSLLAGQINEGLSDRIQALQAVAGEITPAMLSKPATLQTLLENRPLLAFLFNGGTFVTGTDGIAIADVPISTGRLGINYMDRLVISKPLRDGKVAVGAPAIGKTLGAPVFSIVAPIQDAKGEVLGLLVGTINLGLPNFLDKLTKSTYGQSGGYLLVARESRLIVTATDKHRIMAPVGKTAISQRYLGGYEGSDVFVNGVGVEVLSSVKGIPVANWYLAASLPVAEAFAPIRDMQQRMLLATIMLSFLACGVTWWMLRRQLFPVLSTVEKLALLGDQAAPLAPLPVPEQTEVGSLVIGFNRVLKALELRDSALLQSEAFRRSIIDSVAASIAVLDRQGVITAVNHPWKRFGAENKLTDVGVAPHNDIGADYLKICRAAIGTVDEAIAVQAADGIQAVLERRLQTFSMDYPCDGPDTKRWFTMTVTPLNPDGGAVVAHSDITDLKKFEAQLLSAKVESERANDAKSHFLAAVSHDLRQPLAALTLYVGLLDAHAPGRNAKLVPRIKDCANSLGGLLSDLLDLSKLQAGAVVPTLTSFNLADLLNSLQSVHAAQAAHKGLRFRVRPSTLTVQTDRTLMMRLLGNLVANAVQYTLSGGVLIACRRHAQKHWLEVYDTGIGIADDKIESMFAEFSQLNNNSGSGLGLYIVDKTAKLLGLQVRVRSVEGRGSMFAIELPIADPILPTSQPDSLLRRARLRVALVEDQTEVLQVLALTLESIGHEVIAATTGMDLIARLGSVAPDLIVADYHLAFGETGGDVIEDARAIFGAALPALIITADTDKARLTRMTQEGILVIFKPVQIDALRAAIAQVTGQD